MVSIPLYLNKMIEKSTRYNPRVARINDLATAKNDD